MKTPAQKRIGREKRLKKSYKEGALLSKGKVPNDLPSTSYDRRIAANGRESRPVGDGAGRGNNRYRSSRGVGNSMQVDNCVQADNSSEARKPHNMVRPKIVVPPGFQAQDPATSYRGRKMR